MDSSYQRKLIMLQGSGGLSGFVNLEDRGGRLSLKFQATGLERGTSDAHGLIVSLRKRNKLNCGRLRVDTHGQGVLLRQLEPNEMEGLSVGDIDTVAIIIGGQALLAGAVSSGRVDWEALRKVVSPQKQAIDPAKDIKADAKKPPASAAAKAQTIVARMQPNPSPKLELTPERAPVIMETASAKPAPVAGEARQQERESDLERLIAQISMQKPDVIDAIVKLFSGDHRQEFLAERKDDRAAKQSESALESVVLIAETPAPDAAMYTHDALIDAAKGPCAIVEDAPTSAADGPDYPDISQTEQELRVPIIRAPKSIDPIYYTQAEDSASSGLYAAPFAQTYLEPLQAAGAEPESIWPVWSAYRKPALYWPDETADLRELFERGAPDETVQLPGWLFVKAPAVIDGFDSLLGVYAQSGQVLQTAIVLKGGNATEPPAGLAGYEYTSNLADGCWVQWRDYTMLYAQAE